MKLKLKRFTSFAFTLIIAFSAFSSVFLCNAAVTTVSGTVTILPGNTRSHTPDYSYAWLDTVVVRDDVMNFMPKEMEPIDEYPYDLTEEEFIAEASQYMVLFSLNSAAVTDVFNQLIDVVYYAVTVLGLTDDEAVMRDYLINYGIDITNGLSDSLTKTYIAVVYACIKNNALYALYNKEVTIPKGATLEHAMVIVSAAALDYELPSGITTIQGLTLLVMRSYISEVDLPISANPDLYEAEYWAKIAVAMAQDYTVPQIAYADALQSEKDYVDYAYCAAMIKTRYDITILPAELCDAMNSDDQHAVHKLILSTMLREKGVEIPQDADTSTLFDAACEAGCFDLVPEFFSDIFEYNVSVPYDCKKIWLSPFSMCEQLDYGSLDYLKLQVNGVETTNGATVGVELDMSKQTQSFTIRSIYDDGTERTDTVDYVFNFVRLSQEESTTNELSGSGIVGTIEGYIQSALPENNTNAQNVVSEVFSAINGVDSVSDVADIISTYAYGTETDSSADSESSSGSSANGAAAPSSSGRFTTYGDDQNTSSAYGTALFETTTKESKSVVNAAFSAIANNPAAATATPVSLLALSVAAGLLVNKRRKNTDALDDENDNAEDTQL